MYCTNLLYFGPFLETFNRPYYMKHQDPAIPLPLPRPICLDQKLQFSIIVLEEVTRRSQADRWRSTPTCKPRCVNNSSCLLVSRHASLAAWRITHGIVVPIELRKKNPWRPCLLAVPGSQHVCDRRAISTSVRWERLSSVWLSLSLSLFFWQSGSAGKKLSVDNMIA